MGYKLVVLDIDGTIRSIESEITSRTRNAIARVTASGARVTVATGRMFRSAVAAAAELNLESPIITFQGAHVADPQTGEVLWHRPLTRQMTLDALDALDGWDGEILLYDGHRVHASRLTPFVESYARRNEGMVEVSANLQALAADEPTRLVVVGEEGLVSELEQRLKDRFDSRLYVTRSLPHFCEILHPGAGKRNALAWLCRHLGVAQAETVAFGNGSDDAPMLAWAGLGVAIGDAAPEPVAAADVVAPPLKEDGAATILEGLLDHGLVG